MNSMREVGGIGDAGKGRPVVDIVLPVEEFRVRLEVQDVPLPARLNQEAVRLAFCPLELLEFVQRDRDLRRRLLRVRSASRPRIQASSRRTSFLWMVKFWSRSTRYLARQSQLAKASFLKLTYPDRTTSRGRGGSGDTGSGSCAISSLPSPLQVAGGGRRKGGAGAER